MNLTENVDVKDLIANERSANNKRFLSSFGKTYHIHRESPETKKEQDQASLIPENSVDLEKLNQDQIIIKKDISNTKIPISLSGLVLYGPCIFFFI